MLKFVKLSTLSFGFALSLGAFASNNFAPYSEAAVAAAQKEGKTVALAFHKKGCGTCAAQDEALNEAGLNKIPNLVGFRVERRDSALDKVYEQYGFNKNQWAAVVVLKNNKELARLDPGVTSESKAREFVGRLR